MDDRRALEAVTLADELVYDVDLDARVGPQILHGPRRAEVGEHEVVAVPHRRGALRRQVRRAVWADGRDEAQFGVHHAAHVVSEDAHDLWNDGGGVRAGA